MKIKELQKSVNVAWSPALQTPVMLAAGSAAQQLLDTSFNSSNPTLELYNLNLSDSSYDLELVGVQKSQHKFHKLVWSPFDNNGQHPKGVIVGGCESGYLKVYSASKMMAGEEALVAQSDKHNGAVRTVDYNPFKSNLVASASSESEIFIWDVNNLTSPMTPGQKTQPLEDVWGVAWNLQVQHILASAFATRCVIWDLRKNEPIIKLSDQQSRVRWRCVQWHPDIATQLWLASEDDQMPVIQLWDLRYATAPSKTLQIHSRGVLGMTLCPKDTGLMISCAKDNKILCWNANSEDNHGEILTEIASTSQWYSDVTWCPRNPAVVAASSYDGNVSIYSLSGGVQQQIQTSNKILDSFPGMESMSQEHHQASTANVQVYYDLIRPPKWFKRPSGINFGFGGKFVVFNSASRSVQVKQLITDEKLVKQSSELEDVLVQGNYGEYCRKRADESESQHKKFIWHFLKAYFEENPTSEFLNLLGYHVEDITEKFSKFAEPKEVNNVDDITNQMAQLNRNQDGFDINGIPASSAEAASAANIPYKLATTGNEGLICEALLTGNISAAVELCMNAGRSTDAIILASLGGSDLLARTQYRYLKSNESFIANLISAMVMADWSGVISQCTIDSWKEALVAALTHTKDQSPLLCERLGERMQMESAGDASIMQNSILCYICAGNIERIVDAWSAINGSDSLEDSTKLQELVEVVILLSKGMERHGQTIPVYGRYAELLSKYASLLAAQGSLEMALTYIGTSQDDSKIVELRERLSYALGHRPQQQQQFQKPRESIGYASPYQNLAPRNSVGRTMSTSSGSGMPPSAMPPNVMMPQTFNTGLPNATSNHYDSMWNQPVASNIASPMMASPPQVPLMPRAPSLMNPVENIPQPPRPSSVSSVSSQPSGTVTTAKPKRLLDPSVSSNTGSYGQLPPSMPFNPNPNAFNTAPMMNTNPQQMMGVWEPQQQQQPAAVPSYNFQPNMMGNVNGNLPPPPSMPSYPIQKNPTPPPGWNDPPEFKTKSQPKKEASMATPILHPLFANADPNVVPQNNQMMPGIPDQSMMYGQQQQNQLPPTMMNPSTNTYYQPQPVHDPNAINNNQINYSNFTTNLPGTQGINNQMTYPVAEPVQLPKEIPIVHEKPPLPEEFIHFQTVFEEIKSRCNSAANNPQTKRKLDDVSRRLETLYDLLREQRLSPNTLESLKEMVNLIQHNEHTKGLMLHTQMVSGPEFSKIASFMPGIKILLQLAIQLQVYL